MVIEVPLRMNRCQGHQRQHHIESQVVVVVVDVVVLVVGDGGDAAAALDGVAAVDDAAIAGMVFVPPAPPPLGIGRISRLGDDDSTEFVVVVTIIVVVGWRDRRTCKSNATKLDMASNAMRTNTSALDVRGDIADTVGWILMIIIYIHHR